MWGERLEAVCGQWGALLGPAIVVLVRGLVPLLERGEDETPGRHGWVGWLALALGLAVLGLWFYGMFGQAQQHIGM